MRKQDNAANWKYGSDFTEGREADIMMDLIKKTLLTGLGATVTTKEKIEAMLHDFVEKGKITSQEAQHMAERIVEDSKREFEEAKGDFQGQFDEMLRKANVVTQKQLKELEERVERLEQQMQSPTHTTEDQPQNSP